MRVLFDPEPRGAGEIFSAEALAAFQAEYEVIAWAGEDRDRFYERWLPETDVLVSTQPMPMERLALASKLRAIFNVETNFLPNIDYEECFRRGIPVLAPGGVFG